VKQGRHSLMISFSIIMLLLGAITHSAFVIAYFLTLMSIYFMASACYTQSVEIWKQIEFNSPREGLFKHIAIEFVLTNYTSYLAATFVATLNVLAFLENALIGLIIITVATLLVNLPTIRQYGIKASFPELVKELYKTLFKVLLEYKHRWVCLVGYPY
jgi:hypothetical protein